ncbi:MAG: LicD family protein [Treponema sp.]|nr:LicD family protein [Treponema sp.]
MLKILKEVHKICEENNIKYFLSDGTLIGAIRHQGFIPWDDDLDIGMLREDYEKFCKIAPQILSENFILQNFQTDKGYGLQFGKVILKNTVWIEKVAKNTNRQWSGIYIDIFPYDNITENKKMQKLINRLYIFIQGLILIKFKYINISNYESMAKKLKYVLKKIYLCTISKKLLIYIRDSICKRYLNKSKTLVTKYGGNFYKNQNPYNFYKNLTLQNFEDTSFYIPKNYDKILKNLYGNYMEIPPIEKQRQHGIEYFDFGNY